jgi:hypothetical protein
MGRSAGKSCLTPLVVEEIELALGIIRIENSNAKVMESREDEKW